MLTQFTLGAISAMGLCLGLLGFRYGSSQDMSVLVLLLSTGVASLAYEFRRRAADEHTRAS
jgi:hypothetical protein